MQQSSSRRGSPEGTPPLGKGPGGKPRAVKLSAAFAKPPLESLMQPPGSLARGGARAPLPAPRAPKDFLALTLGGLRACRAGWVARRPGTRRAGLERLCSRGGRTRSQAGGPTHKHTTQTDAHPTRSQSRAGEVGGLQGANPDAADAWENSRWSAQPGPPVLLPPPLQSLGLPPKVLQLWGCFYAKRIGDAWRVGRSEIMQFHFTCDAL